MVPWRILLLLGVATMASAHEHHFEGAKGKWVSEEPIVRSTIRPARAAGLCPECG